MGRYESFDEWDDKNDHVSAAVSVDGDAAKKQLGKLDENEVISLLRTLYLKSGQPNTKSDTREDDNGRRGRSRNRSPSGRSEKGKERRTSTSPARNQRGSGRSVKSSSSSMRIFGRGNNNSVCGSKGSYSWRTGGRNNHGKTGTERSKKGSRRGLFGGKSKAKVGDDIGTKPSNIEVNKEAFEYLNESGPLPLGLAPPRAGMGMGPPGHPRLPPSAPLETLEELRNRLSVVNRPNFVRGEAILQAEPVQAITPKTGIGGPSSSLGPHNTVLGQHVGLPRINSLRGTHKSPIVEAIDVDVLSSKTPNAGNLTLQNSPSPIGDDKYDPRAPPFRTFSNFSTPGIRQANTGGNTSNARPGPPEQIMVDPRKIPPRNNQREYVKATFGENLTFVSELSDRRDPWNHSPNSVMSQMFKDLEP